MQRHQGKQQVEHDSQMIIFLTCWISLMYMLLSGGRLVSTLGFIQQN
jgi:hypothetical protein